VSAEVGTIHVLEQDGRASAYWQGASNEAPTFLCAMASDAYNGKPELRRKFMELAAAAATGEHDVVVTKVEPAPAPWWASLPCARCESSVAPDVMHRARMALELAEMQTSPNSGLPLGCCRLRVLGQMTSDPREAQPR
jgi:hypothetical protein